MIQNQPPAKKPPKQEFVSTNTLINALSMSRLSTVLIEAQALKSAHTKNGMEDAIRLGMIFKRELIAPTDGWDCEDSTIDIELLLNDARWMQLVNLL